MARDKAFLIGTGLGREIQPGTFLKHAEMTLGEEVVFKRKPVAVTRSRADDSNTFGNKE